MLQRTEEMKRFAQAKGAATVGVAPVDRFGGAPEGHRPADILKDARRGWFPITRLERSRSAADASRI